MKQYLLTAAVVALPSLASALTLECQVPESSAGGGYISDLYVFEYDEKSGKALVADAWIMYIHDAPIAAKVTEDSTKKLAFSWNLIITNSSGQNTKMQYRATYFKGTKEVSVAGTPGGAYDGNFRGRGTCKVV